MRKRNSHTRTQRRSPSSRRTATPLRRRRNEAGQGVAQEDLGKHANQVPLHLLAQWGS